MRELINNGIKENKGMSLVELIVALSIGTIVASAIAGLITFSVRMYRNETVKTNLQYELQTTLNLTMDSVMQASGVHIKNTGDTTEYALFGSFYKNGTEDVFDGVIFVSDLSSNCLYMNRLSANGVSVSGNGISSQVTAIKGDETYLLAENITAFSLKPLVDETNANYTNPLSVDIQMKFADTDWNGKIVEKTVNDTATIRNYLTQSIYYNDVEYKMNP